MSITKKQPDLNYLISPLRISRIKEQGYDTGFTDGEISRHSYSLMPRFLSPPTRSMFNSVPEDSNQGRVKNQKAESLLL